MKKIVLLTVLIVIFAGLYIFKQSSDLTAPESTSTTSNSVGGSKTNTDISVTSQKDKVFETIKEGKREQLEEGMVKPAVDLYKNADEALEAILKGAKNYDDITLEQFTQMPANCSWCEEFYGRINELMLTEKNEDSKSYLAEVLAISGQVENVASLVNAIKNSESELDADIFAEALEIAIGGDDLIEFLGENLETDNELLKESALAALTNHGTREAVESIYDFTVKSGDPDGFYSLGIGLGEIIPDEESYPLLRQLAEKRDSYSHLAIKSMLNSGDQGLKEVVNLLSSAPADDTTRQMLNDAVDHVAYDENTEAYLNDLKKTNTNPIIQDFIDEIMAELELEASDSEE